MDALDGVVAALVDPRPIELWQEEHTRQSHRHGEASAALNAARMAHERASDAADRALQAGEGNARAAVAAAESAEKELAICQRIHDASAAAVKRCDAARERARGLAHRGLWSEGVKRRLAACRAAEEAQRMMREAENAFREANKLIHHASQNGCPDGGVSGDAVMRTVAVERHFWLQRHVNPDNPQHTWGSDIHPDSRREELEAARARS